MACLNQVVQKTLDLLRAADQLRQIELKLELGTGLPLVMVNMVQIEQVLINLVRNAINAVSAAANGSAATVSIRTLRHDAGTLQVQVADNGHGIAPDTLGRLFKPMFTTKTDGMGMGLAISHSIIEAHGGHLMASNNPTGGATFTFTLPIASGQPGPT